MSRTSSFRLSDELYERLDRFVRSERGGKNSVIVRAIETYLDHHEHRNLAEQARRQSMLVGAAETNEDWLDHADQSGWK
jgi:predicted DNA-binding protein